MRPARTAPPAVEHAVAGRFAFLPVQRPYPLLELGPGRLPLGSGDLAAGRCLGQLGLSPPKALQLVADRCGSAIALAGDVATASTTMPGGTDQAFCYDEQDRLTWAGGERRPARVAQTAA